MGAQPEAGYTVDRISADDISRYISVDTDNPQEVVPTPLAINELTAAHIGNYVVIKALNFGDQAGKAWCERDPLTGKHITTQRTAYDSEGREIDIRIISTCNYRDEAIPAGKGDLYGVVECLDGEYSLRIVNHGIMFE